LLRMEKSHRRPVATAVSHAALSLFGAGLLGAASPAFAQSTQAKDAPELENVVISTGTRSKRLTVTDSASPIEIIGGEELRATGKSSLREALGTLVPSYTAPAQPGGGTSASVRPTKILGLSGDMLLVLVNGKRRHNTAVYNNFGTGSVPVDMDLIPVSSIDHIEVLLDGAAAQYGSDAIAGVLNVILKRNDEGGLISLTGGKQTDSPGDLAQLGANYGLKLGDGGGFINFSLDAREQGPSYAGGDAQGSFYYPLLNGQPVAYGTPGATPDPRDATVDKNIAHYYGRSDRDKLVEGAYNAELPLSAAVTLYSFTTLSHRDIIDTRGAYRPNSVSDLDSIFPNGFDPERLIDENDWQGAVGSKGQLGDWGYDLSTTYARDVAVLRARDTLNASLGPDVTQTRFYLGNLAFAQATTNLDITHDVNLGLFKPAQLSFGLEQRWERYEEGAGEPNSYADGGYIFPAGTPRAGQRPPATLGAFVGTAARDAGSKDRDNEAAYADLSGNVTKDLYASIAARIEHYNDGSGNDASGKLALRYALGSGVALRGTYSNGFRAPSLAQQIFSVTQSSTVVSASGQTQSALVVYMPPDSAAAQSLGARALKPEKSRNASAGVTWDVARNARFTADLYQIDISDMIIKSDPLTDAGGSTLVRDALITLGFANPAATSSAQYNMNAADTRTRGIDVAAELTERYGDWGQVRWSALYNYNKTHILSVDTNAVFTQANATYTPFGRVAQLQLTQSSPHDKLVLDANWDLAQFTTNLRLTRFGGWLEPAGTTAAQGLDRYFTPRWITDLDVNWKATTHINVAVGANNIFAIRPTRQPVTAIADASLPGGKRYDQTNNYGSFSPFGVNGGFYYVRASYLF
jgi:iron complex outermembrane recepter protein